MSGGEARPLHQEIRPRAQKKPTVYEFIRKLGQLRDDVLFGDVWEHPDLSKRDRRLITVAMLAALYRTDEMRGTCSGRSTTA